MLIGAPTAGKTSYISLALCYLQQLNCDAYAIMPTDTKDEMIIADWRRGMRMGIWPTKTTETGLWNVSVRHHYTVPALGPYGKDEKVKWSGIQVKKALINMQPKSGGEVIDHISLYDCAGEDFTERYFEDADKKKISKDVLERCQNSDYFLLFVDAEKIRGDIREVQDVLKRAAWLLQERATSKPDTKFYIAIIFTKCDTLLEHEAFEKEDGSGWDCEKIQQEFAERYKRDIDRIIFHDNLITEYFYVSCVPDLTHTEINPTKGVIATAEWSPRDMAGQIAPLRWISSHFY